MADDVPHGKEMRHDDARRFWAGERDFSLCLKNCLIKKTSTNNSTEIASSHKTSTPPC